MRDVVENLRARTDMPYAPWLVIPAADRRYARLAVLEATLRALEARLGADAAVGNGSEEAFDRSGVGRWRE